MKDSIKSIQTEQNKKEEEMKSKLEERDKQLNAAKVPWYVNKIPLIHAYMGDRQFVLAINLFMWILIIFCSVGLKPRIPKEPQLLYFDTENFEQFRFQSI